MLSNTIIKSNKQISYKIDNYAKISSKFKMYIRYKINNSDSVHFYNINRLSKYLSERSQMKRYPTAFSYISQNLSSCKNVIENFEKYKSNLQNSSPIRTLNIGYNYFRHVNPRRKKILMTLLNSYIKQFTNEESKSDIKKALDIFYNKDEIHNEIMEEPELSEELLWHLNVIITLERIATQYSRFEYLNYDEIINLLNKIPKEKRNRAKFVFTSHPTQPNSISQLKCIKEILKAIEENDLEYLDKNMAELTKANISRVFKKPSYIEESVAYHSICIPNMIDALSMLYELGLKDPVDYFETPGTWMTFDFDNHPEMSVGLMTFTHGHLLTLTINQYLKMISEAEAENELAEVVELFSTVINYANELKNVSENYRNRKISKKEFYELIPVTNVYGIEIKIKKLLTGIMQNNQLSIKTTETSKKINALFKIFGLTGCLGQIRFAGEKLIFDDETQVNEIFTDILKEISLLNGNVIAADMLIIANYEFQKQYELMKKLFIRYDVKNMEIVPLLETFSATNDTDSKITMIASSDTRQRDGLLLTELRTLREFKKNPDKFIYMGQGVTAERGGGPYKLVHSKLSALTQAQKHRHIRTIQGHLFTSEFISRDLVVPFLLNCGFNLNQGQPFQPSQDYMDFLFELDNIVGVPQREMQKSKEFNDFYTKNNLIKTLVESFNFAGSRELAKPFENVKKERAIVQAYINSDRCSMTHPELAYWDRLDETMIKKMSKYYYQNNLHFKYVLYNYGFMIRRFNLEFAREQLGYSEKDEIFKQYMKGKMALEGILNHLGLSTDSDPMIELWNQHLGLLSHSSLNEMNQKFDSYKILYLLQNHQVRKFLKDKVIGVDSEMSLRKLRILQSALANLSPFNGKG